MANEMELDRALVLNKHWQAIKTVECKKALTLVFAERARIVDPVTYEIFTWEQWMERRMFSLEAKFEGDSRYIKTAKFFVEKPEIITLSKYAGSPNRGVPFSRKGVYERDDYQCQYCGKYPSAKLRTLDHIMPVSRGGKSTWLNCVLSCLACNHKKADRTPQEAKMPVKSVPARPSGKQLILKGAMLRESWKPFLKDELEKEEIAKQGVK